jgi:hypothetical protein
MAPSAPSAPLEFQPIPPSQRHTPGRITHATARLYIDRFVEHREAYDFLQHQQEIYHDASSILVRAIVHYRDTVLVPLEAMRAKQGSSGRRPRMPPEVTRALLAFRPLTPRQRQTPERVKGARARLYIDRFVEHRAAHDVLDEQQGLHGHGEVQKMIVRAVLHYRDTVIRPQLKGATVGRGGQMRMQIDAD